MTTHREGAFGVDICPWTLFRKPWRGSGYRFVQIGWCRFWIKWGYP